MIIKRKLHHSVAVTRRVPINLIPNNIDLFNNELTKFFSESYYSQIIDVDFQNTIIFKRFSVFDIISLKPIPFFSIGYEYFFKYLIKILKKKRISITDAIWLTDHWSNNYFHWLTDCLPKLTALSPHRESVVLLPNNYKNIKYIVDSLAVLGYQVHFIKPGIVYSINRLTIPGLVAPTGNFIPELMLKLRTRFKNKLNISTSLPTELIFINRRNNTRQIENFTAVQELLLNYNIKIVYTEELTLIEQIKLFHNTKLLIGVHGAGLTNMLFMQENTNVLELRKDGDNLNNCYFSLASALNINYAYQLCDVDDYNIKTQFNKFNINVTKLSRDLELLAQSNRF